MTSTGFSNLTGVFTRVIDALSHGPVVSGVYLWHMHTYSNSGCIYLCHPVSLLFVRAYVYVMTFKVTTVCGGLSWYSANVL